MRENTLTLSTPLSRPNRVPRLTWSDGANAKTTLVDQRIVIGSTPGAHICLRDAHVSRVHAEIDLRDDGAWVRDLGSRNGTFVGSFRIESARVTERTVVRVGTTEITLDFDDGRTHEVGLWPHDRYFGLRAGSIVMRELFASLHRVAPSDVPVLLQGETGTGKDLVAQCIHETSSRAGGPFVVVDCGALAETLLDAELFGHAKGAFTGASTARAGAFEAAHGGTVFLDEIGELPLSTQPRLLRVLEAGTVRRLGETKPRRVDVRILAATHRDLLSMVSRGEFREDLYFRLAVVLLRIPPIRERLEDIPMLVRHFLGEGRHFDAHTLEQLKLRAWRGNVRELRNFVNRARALSAPEALAMLEEDAPVTVRSPPPMSSAAPTVVIPDVLTLDHPPASYRTFRRQWNERGDREYVRQLLAHHQGNVSAAARDAKLNRTYFHKLIQRLGL